MWRVCKTYVRFYLKMTTKDAIFARNECETAYDGPYYPFTTCPRLSNEPNDCSNSPVCRRTTSDEWTHEPKMAIFYQNAKPPPEISRGHWGYT